MEMNGFQSDKFKGLKVRKDNRVLRALKDHKVILVRKEPKENKALKDCKGRKDHKVKQALKVRKGLLVRREKMDLLVRKALRDHKVPKAQSVQPELKAHQCAKHKCTLECKSATRKADISSCSNTRICIKMVSI